MTEYLQERSRLTAESKSQTTIPQCNFS